jgi:hypothetical protein
VVIVGIIPGLHQMFLSCREAQRALAEELAGDDVLRRACTVSSFAGPMRTNLISMLDGIGVHDHLGIETAAALFNGHPELLHSTSAVLYPAFLDGKNYGGSPAPETSPRLRAFVDQVLAEEPDRCPRRSSFRSAKPCRLCSAGEADRGAIRPDRCLFEFPHPSGGNGHRVRLYGQHRSDMATQVAAWARRAAELPPQGPAEAVIAFAADHVVVADGDPEWVAATPPSDDLGAPMRAAFLALWAQHLGTETGALDVVLAAMAVPDQPELHLVPAEDTFAHARLD